MIIALQETHHGLPFWHSPMQPKEVFDPEVHGKLTYKHSHEMVNKSDGKLFSESIVWPVLIGIHAIGAQWVMAHVSTFSRHLGDGTWTEPKRIWVQFTTVTTELTDTGIPLVVKDGVVLVEHLWGEDNKGYDPYHFIPESQHEAARHSDFWKYFFERKLRDAQESAFREASCMREKATQLITRFGAVQLY